MDDVPEVCPERSQGTASGIFVCILPKGHDGKHRDKFENTWSLVINGVQM